MTPLEEYPILAKALGLERLFVKREDFNLSGSHKDKAIWPTLAYYSRQGVTHFVLSSSGNAAISAAYYVVQNQDEGLTLDVFVSPRLSGAKESRLTAIAQDFDFITIHTSERAKSEAIAFAKEKNYQLIRVSVDALAVHGYKVLAKELIEQLAHIPNLRNTELDLFIPTSSGTTAQGVYEGFVAFGFVPSIHIVQTTKVHLMARDFDSDFIESADSKATAIVDTIGHRKESVVKAVQDSRGGGWVVSDGELQAARELFHRSTEVDPGEVSWDSFLSLAGLQKALRNRREVKNAILLFTG